MSFKGVENEEKIWQKDFDSCFKLLKWDISVQKL